MLEELAAGRGRDEGRRRTRGVVEMHVLTEAVVEPHEVMTHRARSGLSRRSVGEGLHDRERREVDHTRVVVRDHGVGAVVRQLDVTRRARRDHRVHSAGAEVDEGHLVQLGDDRVALVVRDLRHLPEEVRRRRVASLDRLRDEVDDRDPARVELVTDHREGAVQRDVDGRGVARDR